MIFCAAVSSTGVVMEYDDILKHNVSLTTTGSRKVTIEIFEKGTVYNNESNKKCIKITIDALYSDVMFILLYSIRYDL